MTRRDFIELAFILIGGAVGSTVGYKLLGWPEPAPFLLFMIGATAGWTVFHSLPRKSVASRKGSRDG